MICGPTPPEIHILQAENRRSVDRAAKWPLHICAPVREQNIMANALEYPDQGSPDEVWFQPYKEDP